MSAIQIDESSCVRCHACVDECPGYIHMGDTGVPAFKEGGGEDCVLCGHCVAVCPEGAISVGGLSAVGCEPFRRELVPSPEQSAHIVRSRRSVRTYRNETVPRKAIEDLIDIARHAPTAGNSQQVGWTVIDSREQVRRLSGMVVDFLLADDPSPQGDALRKRFDKFVRAWKEGQDLVLRGAPALIVARAPAEYRFATIDCSIALTCIDNSVSSFGLGACWAGVFMVAYEGWEPLRRAVDVVEGERCFGALMLGYPEHEYARIPPRNAARVAWIR